VANMTLEEALKEVLKDDNMVSKYEARVLRELIMSDGVVSETEKHFLERALKENHFDDQAFELLSSILLRSQMDQKSKHK
jgi:uncharacterized membrane protein YebE (DUF533 family)